MQVVYIYDLKGKDKREFNRVKRMFYYRLNKLNLVNCVWKTRSVLVIPEELEKIMDGFFSSFLPNIEIYKIKTKYIEELKPRRV